MEAQQIPAASFPAQQFAQERENTSNFDRTLFND